jgi:hypothetical protein
MQARTFIRKYQYVSVEKVMAPRGPDIASLLKAIS